MKGQTALPYWLAGPGVLLAMVFVAIPLVLTFGLSFSPFSDQTGVGNGFTLANYGQIVSDDYFHEIFLRTVGLAAAVTGVSILIGVPEAYVLSRLKPTMRAISLVIVLGPLLISVIVRTLGWTILLGNDGVINNGLMAIGIISQPLRLMYSFTGMVIGLVHVLVPFMVLSVWTSLQKLDPATEQAAESLGASSPTILWRIVLPQVLPGMLSGGLIVFAMSASAFATPSIIGGRRLKIVPTAIYDEFLSYLNWPLGAALALILLIFVLAVSLGANRYIERRFRQVFQ
ncbi:ABC transporter permease [Agrobacterium vaccinii]|uniref:ABC transporter permease n=1 Tax=Agrobacterium vaccinii TaxID=2735528 RepID=UPI001E4FA8F4|nr:ABC transporter permease [Agrobacterium vaccinii]UHS59848.1 ABC transporter permease [Agrobacterium vaccinii]